MARLRSYNLALRPVDLLLAMSYFGRRPSQLGIQLRYLKGSDYLSISHTVADININTTDIT
jgi:hypothetical protein